MSQYPYVRAALGQVFFLGVFAGDTGYLRRYGYLDTKRGFLHICAQGEVRLGRHG